MYGYAIWLTVATLGVDVGWQRLPEGGVQYLIQIPPATLDALKAGEAIESDIPPTLKDIRSYRITVGNKPLSRDVVTSETKPGLGTSQFDFSRPMGSSSIAGGPPSTTPWPTSPSPSAFTPMPHTLAPEPTGKPLAERPASFLEPAASKPEAKPAPTATAEPLPAKATDYLGTYLTVSLVALSGSLAWNGYLLWMLREARRRYRLLLERTGATEADLEDEEEEEEEEE
jgi:hypothetical protein